MQKTSWKQGDRVVVIDIDEHGTLEGGNMSEHRMLYDFVLMLIGFKAGFLICWGWRVILRGERP